MDKGAGVDMKISACVIAKNEEKNIGKWLESMIPIADEMIVVDTGSTDNTKLIARQSGAVVLDYPWCNDFSAAKNFAIDHAKGEWIIFLDADEYFAPKTVGQVRNFIKKIDIHRDIAAICCRLINIDVDNNNRFMTAFMQLRIFRNINKLRYVGAIHEAVSIPKGKKIEIAKDFIIFHTGYSTSIVKKKLQRNLEMLQKKFAQTNGVKTAQDERYLMDAWYGLGEYSKAVEAAKKLLLRKDLDEDLRGRAYETWVSVCMVDGYPEEVTMHCVENAVKDCPKRADLRMMKGLYLYSLQDYLQAEEDLKMGMEIYTNRTKDYVGMADNAERLIPNVQLRLAEICQMKKQLEPACEHYLFGLSFFPYHESLLCSFFAFMKNNNVSDVNIIEQLNHIYDKDKDANFLVRSLLKEGTAGRVVLYYTRFSDVALPEKLKFQLNGNWYAAAENDAKALERDAVILLLAEENGIGHAKYVLQELYASNCPKWNSLTFRKKLQRMREELSAEV